MNDQLTCSVQRPANWIEQTTSSKCQRRENRYFERRWLRWALSGDGIDQLDRPRLQQDTSTSSAPDFTFIIRDSTQSRYGANSVKRNAIVAAATAAAAASVVKIHTHARSVMYCQYICCSVSCGLCRDVFSSGRN